PLETALAAAGPPGHAGRALRALGELGLVDPATATLAPAPERTELERAPTVRAERARAGEARTLLGTPRTRAA
ncbi:MAG: hypothetical protein ACJ76K_10230, partial [Solirubrobacteraceae bacterium]